MTSIDQPDQPHDTPLRAVTVAFMKAGYCCAWEREPDGVLRCGHCGERVHPADLAPTAQHRIEGASDPDESQLLIGAPCPYCSVLGSFVVAYGPSASAPDQDLVASLPMTTPPDPLAGEETRV